MLESLKRPKKVKKKHFFMKKTSFFPEKLRFFHYLYKISLNRAYFTIIVPREG